MQKCADIERFLRSTASPLRIGDLTIEVHVMHQSKMVKHIMRKFYIMTLDKDFINVFKRIKWLIYR